MFPWILKELTLYFHFRLLVSSVLWLGRLTWLINHNTRFIVAGPKSFSILLVKEIIELRMRKAKKSCLLATDRSKAVVLV